MVVQTAEVRDGHDPAIARRLVRSRDWRVLVQREVSAPLMIVGKILLEVTAQRALVPDDHVVQALAPQGADHALDERILPRCPGRRQDLLKADRCCGPPQIGPVDRVTIPEEEARRGVARPRR